VAVLTPSNRLSRGRRSIQLFSKLFSSLEEIELRRRGGCEFAGRGTNGEFSGSLAYTKSRVYVTSFSFVVGSKREN
jgi:hypothetical protein